MTSKQVMLTLSSMLGVVVLLAGCDYTGASRKHQYPYSPYSERQVWAVAPLRNESGSGHADGVRIADHLSRQLTLVHGIDTVPVNRVLAAMHTLQLSAVTSKADALALRKALGVDGLVAGTITAWEPYDPPKLGLAVELYLDPVHESRYFDIRRLTGAAVEGQTIPDAPYTQTDQPVSAVSGYYDAADPVVRGELEHYGQHRGVGKRDPQNARLYRISMDLYSEFVSHAVGSRLLKAERIRVTPAPPPDPKPAETDPQLTQASPG